MYSRRTPLVAALLTAATAPLAWSAFAQDDVTTLPEVKVQATTTNDDDYAPTKTTVGGKVPMLLRDVPQSVTVINKAVMEAQGATDLTEALRNVPGITLSAGEGGVIGDNINLRGFSARTDIFLDGFRDRSQVSRETFFLEAVEVLKGPSSMQFGRGSTGGVINQVSKVANLTSSNEFGVSIGTDDYYRTTLDINQAISPTAAFRIAGLAHSNNSTRDITESERFGIAPSIRFGIGTPTELTISSVHQRRSDIPDYGFPLINGTPIDVSTNNFYGLTDDNYDQDSDILSVRLEHQLSTTFQIRSQIQYNSSRIDASPTPVSIANSASVTAATPLEDVTITRSRRDREIDDSSLYNQTDLIARFETAGMRHTVTTGVEVGRDNYENQGYTWTGLPSTNAANPFYQSTPDTATRTLGTYTDSEGDTFALYLNDQLELTKEWKVTAGLRWDRYAVDSLSRTAAGVDTQRSRTDKMTSGRIGVIYQPSDFQSYYASYGTSFNPSAEAMTLSDANKNLDPEKNRSMELGGKLDLLDGGLSLNGALFRVDKTNARTTDPLNSDLQILDGENRVQGFELGVTGRITANWQVFSGYTFLDSEITKSNDVQSNVPIQGKKLQNTPKHTASLWTTYRFLGDWEAGGGLIYSADRFVNNANTATIDGYTRFDATLAYHQPEYDIRFNLQNLTDEEYFETASSGRAVPVEGRTGILSVSYRF
ncbi:TonB-dependent receptor [Beggiatoa leptomitoformis]|uniref:TonB-dependent siderophore receptor n=1 Tax=Beggiatoa leptomitoformis TaxID=288004 RepID=A0A2N9YCI3_9GAMM|nr:TonB-dependent siderophore receptor [Beggiatoa leptomitoformis]ALG66530.1 TonB-dependent siderophore receptor [Beggiatoa leptomitoformis]AUI68173.1 TonB-dependent siderophore receptor [Beggiatoa leptomitoformis]